MSERHICSGLLPDGDTCPICWAAGMIRSKLECEKLLRGDVRTDEDYIDPTATFTPSGGLK